MCGFIYFDGYLMSCRLDFIFLSDRLERLSSDI